MAVESHSQEIKIVEDTTNRWARFIPTGVRVGADLIAGTKTYLNDDYSEINFQADIDFYRYFFSVEYGRMKRSYTSDNGFYETEGSYFSVGPDMNFLHRDPDRSALFFGFRYAFGTFSDNLTYSYVNPVYGDGTNTVSNDAIRADWYELVGGMKVRMWEFFWLGYTARFKFGVDTFEDNILIPNTVPGYGRADKNVSWGFNYYLIFRIPVRKAPEIIVPED